MLVFRKILHTYEMDDPCTHKFWNQEWSKHHEHFVIHFVIHHEHFVTSKVVDFGKISSQCPLKTMTENNDLLQKAENKSFFIKIIHQKQQH